MRGRVSGPVAWSALAAAVVLAFLLIGELVSAISPTPSGPALSSYATTPGGVAAWTELLQRDGHRVSRLREPLPSARLPVDGTLVILGAAPLPSAADRRALARFVAGGGRLITTDTRLQLTAAGRGRVIALSSPGFLQNRELGRGSNAFRALRIVGSPGRPVLFDEVVHGYGPAIGLAALPARWWFGIVLLALALSAWALSRGLRLGGSDPVAPPDPGPRAVYVEAMAQTLVRSGSTEELAARAGAATAVETNFQEDAARMALR